jgi:hypothetical protein
MQDYADGLAAPKLSNNSGQTANKDDLFTAALNSLGRALARTAAELLYWSQFAKHRFKGRLGIYKEDQELGRVLGVHPKTAGRHVLALCAGGPGNQAEADAGRPKLFDVEYGPQPRARSGRSRWLFVRPEGLKIIAEALELRRLRRERIAPADRKKKLRPHGSDQSDRSPQNAPTHISHKYLPGEHSGALSSSAKEKEPGDTSSKKESQAEVNRLKESWRKICEQSGRHDLVWRDQDVDRYAKELAETVTASSSTKSPTPISRPGSPSCAPTWTASATI